MSAKSVRVVCRFRFEKPFDFEGKDDPFEEAWEIYPEESTIKIRDKTFVYDSVLGSDTTQEEAYEKVGRETITDFMNGFNATIFAYGQSGSGKTFSMVGPDEINDQLALDFKSIPEKIQGLFGTIPRATLQMFDMMNAFIAEGAEYTIYTSYIEIYMEEITCLLCLKEKLKIKEFPDGNIEIEGKQKNICKTPEDIFKVIATGTKNKTTGGTKQNARSSRSHCLLVVEVESKSVEGQKKKSKLNLIDLAGSEKQRNTGATGDRAKEAIKINLSLTSLNMVFMALTTPGENKYIPFKDSKLTRILKDSLGGNSLTTLLCTASRKVRYCEDTIGTFGFAQRAKRIKNEVKQNVEMGVKEYKYLCDALKAEIMTLRGDLKKQNIPIHLVTDKKVLAFLPQDAISGGSGSAGEVAAIGDGSSATNEGTVEASSSTSNASPTRGDLKYRKRASLLNLDEEQLILKYCELKAKYDNLLESASQKIQQLTESQNIVNDTKDREVVEVSSKEDKELIAKYEQVMEEKEKVIYDLNQKIKELTSENESQKEMLDLNLQDITNLNERIDKHKSRKKTARKERDEFKAELDRYSAKVDELFNKVKESEQANAVYNFKIEELERALEKAKNEKKADPEMEEKLEKLIKENEEQKKRINELEEDLKVRESAHVKDFEHLKEEGELKLKQLESQQAETSQGTIDRLKVEFEIKHSEMKKEMSVLQSTITKLIAEKGSLEIKVLEAERKSTQFEKSSSAIKSHVNIDQKSNIFGGLLKKSGEGNKFLKEAQREAKNTEQVLNEVWKDKIEDLKKLRENIIRMSPKTVSTRSVPDDDYQNIDFDDEEAFKKMQAKLQEREQKHQQEKERLQKLKEEMEQKK